MRLLLLVLAVGACQRPPRPVMLEPSSFRVMASALSASETPGLRLLYGATSCQWAGPNPVVLPAGLPVVGRELVVRWQLSCVPPAPTVADADGDLHPPLVVLLVSTRPLEAPVPAGGAAPGCWLLVAPDSVVGPSPESWLTYDTSAGVVTMRWTPSAGMEGSDFYSQLLVAVPGANPLGIVSSAGLHLRIGSP